MKTQAGGGGEGNFEIEKKSINIVFNFFLLSLKYCSKKIKTMKLIFFSLKFNLDTCNLTPLYWFDTVIDNKIRMRFLTFVVDKSVRIYRW